MVKKFDIELVRCLLWTALMGSVLVLFWFIFFKIRDYQQISAEVEDYLRKSLLVINGSDSGDILADDVVDRMLNQRLDTMKELLSLLIHVVIVLFGFVSIIINNNSLVAVFSLIVSSGLMANIFIPLLYNDAIIVLAVILFTLSWLYFDLKLNRNRCDTSDSV